MHHHTADHPTTESMWSAPFWDERYGSAQRVWSGNPNPQLVAEVAGLVPGTALDAGCGEGADAHWLARRGWRVTALDVSTVALQRGAAHAGPEIADRITWRQADLLGWAPDGPATTWSVPSTCSSRVRCGRRSSPNLASAVAPGGTLLLVGHHPSDMQTSMRRPDEPDLFFTAEQVAATLDRQRWEVVVAAARPRPAVDPDGQEITIADAVLRARRRP